MREKLDTAEPGASALRAEGSLRYFSASARNLVPRLIHLLAIATIASGLLGPVWTAAWSTCALTVIISATWLTRAAVARRSAGRSGPPKLALTLINCANSGVYAFMAAAMWSTAEPVGRLAGVVTLSVTATYTLLQYYADRKMFFVLQTPAAVAASYIFVSTFLRSSHPSDSVVVLLSLAVVISNLLHFSRRNLNRSRTSLRDARLKAREGEQAAEAASVAKGQFLATMSHEIRTPLNGVLGMAQAMASDELNTCQRYRLAIIQRSGEALLAILNDILDFSKIEAGKIELEMVAFDLAEVATGALAAFTGIANQKGLSFNLDLRDTHGTYRGDPIRIRQVLYNLISNAVKFTETGSIDAYLAWGDGQLTMSVSDTGPGITPEVAERLFQKFVQADASTTRRFGGTGLGLAICRSLADLMGGSIALESEFGRGARFTVIIPLERVDEQPMLKVAAGADAAPTMYSDRPLRVLVAEDNEINQLVLVTLLHQIDVQPSVVSDGAAAVEAWEREDWDIILMDVQMPKLDGPDATRRIRDLEAITGRPRTAIIAVSANAMAHQVQQYLEADMDGHIPKPIEISRLFAAIDTILAAGEEASLAAQAQCA